MSLLLLTALGGMFLAQRGVPPFGLLAATLIGGAAASGGAASLNHYFDRDIDERMRRTRRRPLPAHRISTGVAIWWGIALNVVAFIVLAVFTNLLANGIQYNRDGGQVTLTITPTASEMILSVADTGVGISPEDQVRVFERFFRADTLSEPLEA